MGFRIGAGIGRSKLEIETHFVDDVIDFVKGIFTKVKESTKEVRRK